MDVDTGTARNWQLAAGAMAAASAARTYASMGSRSSLGYSRGGTTRSFRRTSGYRGRTISRRSRYARGVGHRSRGLVRRTVGRDTPFYVRRARLQPLHYISTFGGLSQTCTVTPFILHVNLVARGTSINERLSNSLYNLQWHLRGSVEMPVGVGASPVASRCSYTLALVYDKRPVGVLPVFSDIFDGTTPLAFQRMDTRGRFEILWRVEKHLHSGSDTSHQYDVSITVNRVTRYTTTDTTGAIGAIETGALYLVGMGVPEGTGDDTVLNYNYRSTFNPN